MRRTTKAVKSAVRKQTARHEIGITEDDIRARAYELYVARGATSGHDLDDWLQAERDLGGMGDAKHQSL